MLIPKRKKSVQNQGNDMPTHQRRVKISKIPAKIKLKIGSLAQGVKQRHDQLSILLSQQFEEKTHGLLTHILQMF